MRKQAAPTHHSQGVKYAKRRANCGLVLGQKLLLILLATVLVLSLSPAPSVHAQTFFYPPAGCTASSLSGFYVCGLQFVAGWNLISLPVVPVANSTFPNTVPGIFGTNTPNGHFRQTYVLSVWTFVAATGSWQYCTVPSGNPTSCGPGSTLTSMVDGKGYWVNVVASFNLEYPWNGLGVSPIGGFPYYTTYLNPSYGGLVGSVIPPASPPPSYALAGPFKWNLVGFKPQPDPNATLPNPHGTGPGETVANYLASLPSANYDQNSVWIYDSFTSTWTKSTAATASDIYLSAGQAMWILVYTPSTLNP